MCAWTLREGVTNVIRHSGASSCSVTLDETGICVRDDGTGPEPGTPGTGLVGLAERAEAAGAHLRTRGLVPHGFELAVRTTARPVSGGVGPGERVDA